MMGRNDGKQSDYIKDQVDKLKEETKRKERQYHRVKKQEERKRSRQPKSRSRTPPRQRYRSRSPIHQLKSHSKSSSSHSRHRKSANSAEAEDQVLQEDLKQRRRDQRGHSPHSKQQTEKKKEILPLASLPKFPTQEILKAFLEAQLPNQASKTPPSCPRETATSASKDSTSSSRGRKRTRRESQQSNRSSNSKSQDSSSSSSNNSNRSASNSSQSDKEEGELEEEKAGQTQELEELQVKAGPQKESTPDPHQQRDSSGNRSISPTDRDHRRISKSKVKAQQLQEESAQQARWVKRDRIDCEELRVSFADPTEISVCHQLLSTANPFETLYLYQTLIFWRRLIRAYTNLPEGGHQEQLVQQDHLQQQQQPPLQ